MFDVNNDNSIYVTRGDIVFFKVTADNNGVSYTFQPGDVLRIKIYGRKDCGNVVLQKDFPVLNATSDVEIYLGEADTKIGDIISKPIDYWYEIELNPSTNPQTIIGYDEEGAVVFRLFPEGADIPEYTPSEEDIPIIDEDLDVTSSRHVENRAVARAIIKLSEAIETLEAEIEELHS